MFYTGFADEAATDLDGQIRATREIGWSNIESRNINGTNIHNLPDDEFETVSAKLADAGVAINCFGSEVANWGKDPFKESDFQLSIEMLERAIKRMKRLNCTLIRGMSFAVQRKFSPRDRDVENEVFRKVNHLVKICESNGIIYGHENCMNYGGQSYEHTLRLLENVKSPNFKLIFDTGNPVFTDLRLGSAPYVKQSAWDFYRNVREFIYYVHIKDAVFMHELDGAIFPKARFTFAGEGDGDVRRIVGDLLSRGYDGGFSMEPHMGSVFHEQDKEADEEKLAALRYANYIEYGRRFMALCDEARKK